MFELTTLVNKARYSAVYRFLLNRLMWRLVPFNAPHKIRITHIGDDSITICAGHKRRNLNHIKGIHACLIATMCEYVSGLRLLLYLNPKEYRIILKNINMTYHYQAKTAVYASFTLKPEIIQQQILAELTHQEAIFKEFAVELFDENKNHICTGLINWQIKAWKNVKAKL